MKKPIERLVTLVALNAIATQGLNLFGSTPPQKYKPTAVYSPARNDSRNKSSKTNRKNKQVKKARKQNRRK